MAAIAVSGWRIGILALLVAALGAYLYWVEVPRAEREAAGERVVPMDVDRIARLAIRFPDRRLELARQDDRWKLTAPITADADDGQVKGLLTTLTTAKIDRHLDDAGDRAAFGLEADALHVEVADEQGATVRLTVGRTTPIGSKTYIVRDDDPTVALTTSNLRVALNKQPADLRDKQLLTFAENAVTRIEIAHRDGPPVVLERKDANAWTVSPGEHVADLTEVRAYLSALRATRAVVFVDEAPEDLARYGLAPPRVRVAVWTGGDAPAMALLLGDEYTEGETKRIYAKRDDRPTVVGLGEWSERSIDKDVASFRDKTILGFDPERVGRIEIQRRGESPVVFERADDRWTVAGDAAAPLDQTTVTRYLTDLRDLKGTSIVQEPPADPLGFGLADPALRVVLTDREGEAIGTLLATKQDDTYYAMRAGGPAIFDLRDYLYARIDKARDAFAPLPPPKAPAAATP